MPSQPERAEQGGHAGCRKLNGVEKFHLNGASTGSTVCILTVARVEPPVTRSMLQEAATAIQQRHTMLRATIRFIGGEPYFEFGAQCKPVQVREYPHTLDEAVDGELDDPPTGVDIGWHLALSGEHILLAYHHSFLDGRSVMFVLQDLLSFMDGVELADVDDVGTPAPLERNPGPEVLFRDFQDLEPQEQVPFVGRWRGTRPESWVLPRIGKDPKTFQYWEESGKGTWFANGEGGAIRALGRIRDRGDTLYGVEIALGKKPDTHVYGIGAMLRDGTLYQMWVMLVGEEVYLCRADDKRAALPDSCAQTDEARAAVGQEQKPARLEPPCLASPSKSRLATSWRQLTPEVTTSLRRRCRDEGTTIQGILGAAIARILRDRVGAKKAKPLLVASPVDVRQARKVGPRAVGDLIGCTFVRLDGSRPLWDAAREYRLKNAAAVRLRGHMYLSELIPSWSRKDACWCLPRCACFAGLCSLYRQAVRKLLPKPLPSLVVTSRGAFSVATPLRSVTSIHAMNHATAEHEAAIWLLASSVNGSLCLTVQVGSGSMLGPEVAGDIADRLVAELTAAAGVAGA